MNSNDCWNTLGVLQRSLKKQFLLVQKQQQEKVKLKRQIQQLVRSYHFHLISLHTPGAQLLKEEGFDNCYNFIKDVVVTLSTDHRLGRLILSICQENSALPALVIHGLYENVQTNDAYAKGISKLMYTIMQDLANNNIEDEQKDRAIQAWKLYMQKMDREAYFQHIADSALKKLLRQEYAIGGLCKTVNPLLKPKSQKQLQNIDKDQLMAQFMDKIETQADLCLQSIKIPLRALSRDKAGQNRDRIWRVVSHFYLKPFLKIANNSELPSQAKERVLQFVDQLVSKWGFTGQLASRTLQQHKQGPRSEEKQQKIQKIAGKLVQVNEQRLADLIAANPPGNHKIQITILGSCLNFLQLYELFILIHSHRQAFSKLSQRIVTRTQKIFQIAPKLQILHRDKPNLLYVSLCELRYQQSISSDYYANYTIVYRGQTLKQMLKQVLVQMQNLSDLRANHKNTLTLIFKCLSTQTDHNGVMISPQLQMKIKYLVYLFNMEKTDRQMKVMKDMLRDLEERDSNNIKLYEDTKFSLLKVYCNLKQLKSQIKYQKQSQSRVQNRIKLIRKLQALKLDLCLTSKSTRNQSHIIQSDHLDKYRYRLSSADDFLIQSTSQCIHKQNTFTGRNSHPHYIHNFLAAFAGLDQVKYYIRKPSFLNKGGSIVNPYMYCNEGRIGEAMNEFVGIIVSMLKLTPEQKAILESVILRSMHQLLLGGKDGGLQSPRKGLLAERESPKKMEGQSPKKRREVSQIKRRGSFSQQELQPQEPLELTTHEQQLHVMGKRYLQGLMECLTPQQKMRSLKDIIQIYKLALSKGGPATKGAPVDKKVGEEVIQRLLVKTVMTAKVPNLHNQLAFLQMFLPEERLMSGDGKVLKQFEKAVVKALAEGEARRSGIFEMTVGSSQIQ